MKYCKAIVAALILGAGSSTWADSYTAGLTSLTATNLSAALSAFSNAALPSNPSPAEIPDADVYLALTRLLSLPTDSATSGLLNEMGFSSLGRNVYDWKSKPEKDPNGHTVLPPAFQPEDLAKELVTDVVPTLGAAKTNLAQITSTSFTLLLPATVTHFAGDVTIDYGDVQMLQAMLDAETVFGYEISSWNLYVKGGYGAASNSILANKSIETFLTAFPTLLTFTNSVSAGTLALARTAFVNAATEYFAASQFIRSRAPGQKRLFNLDANDLTAEANFRTTLNNLVSSLNGPVAINSKSTSKVNLGALFSYNAQHNLRTFLPQQAPKGAVFLWDTFPDTTLGGVVTGLTQTNLGKIFIKMLHEQAQLAVPGVTFADVVSPSGLNGQLNGVVRGADGSLYGTSAYGGSMGYGAVFKAGTTGTFKVIYSFGVSFDQNGNPLDGGFPSGLALGSDGNLYGTTQYGGGNGEGTIFKISTAGSLKTVYNFGDQDDGSLTGGNPLIQGTDGNFYGATQNGGNSGGGVIFQFAPSTKNFVEMASFPNSQNVGGFGGGPGALVQGKDGNLYGTTQFGGDNGTGSLFQFNPNASGQINTIYSFPGSAGAFDPYGNPLPLNVSTLVQANNGLFYGVTQYGGNNYGNVSQSAGDGSLFSFDAVKGQFTTLYSFDENHFDGFGPIGPLVQGANGDLYGITSSGGANGNGTLYQYAPGPTAVPSFLVWFNENIGKQQSEENGNIYYNSTVAAGLIKSGSLLYGTAPSGNGGAIFSLNPGSGASSVPPPTITSQPATPMNLPQGGTLNLTVGASGTGPFTYAWQVNGTPLTDNDNVSGSATANLEIYPLTTDNSGTYNVVVGNGSSSVTSKVSVVTVGIAPTLLYAPASVTDLVGSTATFSVSGNGTPPLHFQWKKNGTATANNVAGATSGTLTLANLTLANAGTYVVVVANAYGSVTSAPPTVLTVVQGPKITVQPAPPVGVLQGEKLSLKVTASGSGLSYFWMAKSGYLTNGGNISGADTSNLVIYPAYVSNTGPYSVVVSNNIGAVMSSAAAVTIGADHVAPGVTILSPATGARSNAPVVFRGTATDNVQVTNVNYWITNLNNSPLLQGQAMLTTGLGGVSNWTFTTAPAAGSNVLVVQSQDFSSNNSTPASVKFFLKSPVPLAVNIFPPGSGSAHGASFITGDAAPTNGAGLNVGESYSITATAGSNYFFSSWTGTAGTTNGPTLNFIMQSNTSLMANFVTNIFLGAAGIYNGLFSNSVIGVTAETAGMISGLTLKTNGMFTATLNLDGASPLSGTFSHDGFASNQVVTTLDGKVTVELYIIPPPAPGAPRTITGYVIGTNSIISNGLKTTGWTSDATLVASLADTSIDAGSFTMLIPPSNDPNVVTPPGYGFAVLTNRPAKGTTPASVTISGALADGTVILQNVPIGEDNGLPVYLSPYNNNASGLLFGRLSFLNVSPSGSLTWIRKASTAAGIFKAGFTNNSIVIGSVWSPMAPALPNGPEFSISGANLLEPLNFSVLLSKTNLVPMSNVTDFISGSVNTNTGQFTIMFYDGSVKVTGQGALLQGVGGNGFFILGPTASPTNAGSISLLIQGL